MSLKNSNLWILVLAAAQCGFAAREAPRPGFNFFSKQQDVQLGQEAAQQVRQKYQVVQNPFLQDYIKKVGDRLAGTPEARESGFPFTFTLLNDPQVNAFALPGGPMFILTGLIKSTDDEAQLAAVMAHEMSHVILRHGTHEASKANLIQLPAMLAGAALGNNSLLGALTKLGASGFILKFSRDAESQADALGARLMAESGYDPMEMARFFGKLQAEGGQGNSRLSQFLSDHPNPGNRERAIQAEAADLQGRYGFETGGFQRAKQEVAGIPPPKGAAQTAATTPAAAPAGSWRQVNAQGFSLSYPGNWQVYGDRSSSMMTIAPRDGLVQDSSGNVQIASGAMVSYFVPENGTDLRSATDDLIHHLHAQNAGMRATSKSSPARVGGQDGLVTMLESNSPAGGNETDALLTVMRPEGLFYLVFVAPSRDYPQMQGAFRQMMDSIRFGR